MFTRADAEKLGWTFDVNGEDGVAFKTVEKVGDDGVALEETLEMFQVTSGTPLFSMLAEVAELEGVGFAEGRGGDQTVTPKLVAACSGETYKPEVGDVVQAVPVEDRVVSALEQLPDGPITKADLAGVISALIASEVKP